MAEDGYRGLKTIDLEFRVYPEDLPFEQISEYIESRMKNFSKLGARYFSKKSSREIHDLAQEQAKLIVEISEIMGIDPFAFTGLIEKESKFNPEAISPGKAVGLTQIVRIAFKEIFHQLGVVKNQADYEAIEYFQRSYNQARLIFPAIPPLSFYTPHRSLSSYSLSKLKKMLLNNQALSVLFGAIYFKVSLSLSCNTEYCVDQFSKVASEKVENYLLGRYRLAFIRYNGDNSSIKSCSSAKLSPKYLKRKYCYSYSVLHNIRNIRRSLP